MARTPATHPRLASLYLLVAVTLVLLHADAQRDCTAPSQACVESGVCTECTFFISGDSFVDCAAGIGAEIGSCEYTEQLACCVNEVSGIDCVGDPVTFEFLECFYDPTEACDGDWTCSGDTTNGGDTTPAPVAASGTDTPVAGGGGGGGAETTAPAAPTATTTSAGIDDTMAPSATDGGESPAPTASTTSAGVDDTMAPSSADGGVEPAPTATTTSAGVDDTMAPSATDGGMSPAPTASTNSTGGEETMAPSSADGDRALDITPAPSPAAALPSATTTTTSMAGESETIETMAPTAAGDGDRDMDVTPSPVTGEAGGSSAPTTSGADETEAPT
ncbi:unnamed protein product, partial [Ectocarpus sp. 13 AM-2016]